MPRHLREPGVAYGAVTTVIAFIVLSLVAAFIPFGAVQDAIYEAVGRFWDFNPFPLLKYFGGVPAGIVAVYLADVRTVAGRTKVAILAAVYGWLLIFLVWVGYSLATSGYFPPPILIASVVAFINALWFLPIYVAGAVVGAMLVTVASM